ncbi:hypothetical protein [Alkalibacterium sp. 20]|uniref:hypothetical protein n=1 Tax=Alkalibacterium sp. 20 TaxID=1798803 RepID=UPI00090048B0|nr:hypothetical protein [Alkalibacterium sp. 20]OJF97113.1 hypothetical protein AX762_00830 [Alkalibacterium sp. 20]
MKKSLHNFLKFTNFELERLSKFLFALMGITFIANLVGYIYTPMKYMGKINEYIAQNSATSEQAIQQYGPFSFYNALNSFWIVGPIALGISGFIFYSFFIWYREWFGKNTFAYRLLMLPIHRMTLFYSKLVVVFIGIFTLISTQMISLFIGYPIVSAIIENTYYVNQSLMEAVQLHPLFLYLFPLDLGFFLTINAVGLVVLLVLFTAILMERSYAVKGIVLGIIYAVVALTLVLLPLFLPDLLNNHYILYGSELIIIEAILLVIVAVLSLFTSRHLINKKITV